jgi:hypothetical protein
MNLLICGDSFAADWTVKYSGQGWPNMLTEDFSVTNLAQAGCSEYKILKQLESADLSVYDKIVVSHTSPYRIYIEHHPIHYNDPLHKNCDLIYTDIKEHVIKDKSLQPMVEYFEKYFDFDHAKYMHGLLCEKIQNLLQPVQDRVLHISNIEWEDLYQFPNMINFAYLFETNKGLMNHFDSEGNKIVYNKVKSLLI